MFIADDALVRSALPYPELIEAIAGVLRTGCVSAPRAHHEIAVPHDQSATLLLMPAWTEGRYIGVKVLTVFPGNAKRGVPTLAANYLMFDANDGRCLACMEAGELTARRTAAASALAAKHLARRDATRLTIVGTGRVARELASAHCSVRSIERIRVWGRDPEKARALAASLPVPAGVRVDAVVELEEAIRDAHIVSCATMSTEPLVKGEWLSPGMHLDLVGAFKPTMSEANPEAIRRASLFVDTRHGALHEGGDIISALQTGAIREEHILADLAELVASMHPGRTDRSQITAFKSVGMACEDLAAAVLVYEGSRQALAVSVA